MKIILENNRVLAFKPDPNFKYKTVLSISRANSDQIHEVSSFTDNDLIELNGAIAEYLEGKPRKN